MQKVISTMPTIDKAVIQLGFDLRYRTPITADLVKTCHLCACGTTGSGKSLSMLYILFYVLRLPFPVELYLLDGKGSGDFNNISPIFANGLEESLQLFDRYFSLYEKVPEGGDGTLRICIIDEYAALCIGIESQYDKKTYNEFLARISRLAMTSRSKNICLWLVMQRPSAQYFKAASGVCDLFNICLGYGNLSPDAHRSLFAGEHFEEEENFRYGKGQGIALIEGRPVCPIATPFIADKEKLKALLRKLALDKFSI